MTVSIGVLGTGRIGVMHAELIAQRMPGARLAGVFDVVSSSASAVGDRLGCQVFASPTELMASKDVDAFAICTSTNTHVELDRKSTRLNSSHVSESRMPSSA